MHGDDVLSVTFNAECRRFITDVLTMHEYDVIYQCHSKLTDDVLSVTFQQCMETTFLSVPFLQNMETMLLSVTFKA